MTLITPNRLRGPLSGRSTRGSEVETARIALSVASNIVKRSCNPAAFSSSSMHVVTVAKTVDAAVLSGRAQALRSTGSRLRYTPTQNIQ